jgi:hypothetical protein
LLFQIPDRKEVEKRSASVDPEAEEETFSPWGMKKIIFLKMK